MADLSDEERTERVLRELAKTDEERWVDLGRAASPLGLGADEGLGDLTAVGRTLLQRVTEQVQEQVCSSITIRMIYESGGSEDAALILPVLDIVATVLSGPAVFTATAGVLRLGLGRLCKTHWISPT
jgi:hypothetical protein